MLLVTLCSLALIFTPFTRSALCTDMILFFNFNDNVCGDNIEEIHFIIGGIISKIYLLIEICVFIHLLKLAFRYPIDNDKFYLKREFISIFIIWYFTHSILYSVLNIVGVIVDFKYSFYISTIRNILISTAYAISTYMRRDMNNDEIKSILKDFDSFMYCHVYYSFFKEYVANNHEDDYKLLTFWIEYNIFKKEYTKYRKCNPNTSNISNRSYSRSKYDYNNAEYRLHEHAENIYLTYFNSNRTSSTNNNMYAISFPVDIMEKVDEIFMEKRLEVERPEDVFDEAFDFVHNKLYNIFLHFCRNENEYKKLENALVFIDFYEIKRVKNTN
jgi:hypothetical protein